ncbi:MAG: hypothetical protein NTZ21_18000 [Actinobacteria bacterium]|nr:hypothetical protein [Actinomycetota bacterium]
MRAPVSRSLLVGMLACSVVVLPAACSGDDGAGGDSGSDGAATTAAASTAPPITTAAPPVPVDGCPSGDWLATQEELQAFYDTVGAMTAMSIIVAGDAELRLGADGRLSFVLTGFRFAQDAGGSRIDLLVDGSIDGTYTVDGAAMTTDALVATATASASIDGTEMDVDPVLQNFVEQFPFDGAGYRCDGDVLVLDIAVGSAAHVMTLLAI